jgi:hypothetical protein
MRPRAPSNGLTWSCSRASFGHVRRHQVAAGGQDLAELDEDRPQLLQRQAQARAARLPGDVGRRRRHERARCAPSRGTRPASSRSSRR